MKGYEGTENRPISQNPTFKSITVGTSPNVTVIDSTGTSRAKGIGTCYRDELNDLTVIAKGNPSDKITIDQAEGTVDWLATATLTDYASMNIQLNHDRVLAANLSPHIHWFQASSITPNWCIQYRYQKLGATKVTSWTTTKWQTNAFSYSTGTIQQLSEFPPIAPVAGDGISDILQVRILRDKTNATSLFSGVDQLVGNAKAINFDVHIEIDMLGSASEYLK